jgi:AcrR family transcriptional regulator
MSIPSNITNVKPRRKYQSKLREAQAEATRQAIIDAALAAFLEHGYIGTTMKKIADSAGVVVETIYRGFDGKAGLFKAAVEAAVAGGTRRAERPVEDRPAIRAVIDEPDPRRKIERYADTQPGIQARLQPLYQTLAEAAAVQAELAEIRDELETQRLHGMARFAQDLAQAGGLRPEMTVDEARDLLWTINSHAVYRMLITDRGWTPERFRNWLATTLAYALLPTSILGSATEPHRE